MLQTLDRGLEVLELLAKREWGPTELSKAIGVDRATVHRILHTLVARGFAEHSPIAGRYRADLRRLLTLSFEMTGQRESGWLTVANSYLEELRLATKLSSNLCVPSGAEVVYLMQVLGEGLTENRPPGTRRPLHCSAVGKAYLGSLPEPEQDAMLATLQLVPLTPSTIASRPLLKQHLRESRSKGYFVDRGEHSARIRAVAAPVFDQHGRVIATVGVSGPADDPAFQQEDDLGALVVDVASRMSTNLGHTPKKGAMRGG